MKKLKKRIPPLRYRYTLIDVLNADPDRPMPEKEMKHQLERMQEGFSSLVMAANPTVDDWRVCSDAVNLLETLVEGGLCEDASGLLQEASQEMGNTGKRYASGGPLRLSGKGIFAVRSVLEDYAEILGAIAHRTIVSCHRRTERRIYEIQHGKKLAHDIEVVAI